jgi:hypothetical protein
MSPFLPQAPSTYATELRPCSPYSLPAIPAVSPCWECLEPPWFQHETSPFIHYQALKAFFLYSIMPTILLLPLQILTSQLFKWSPCGVHVWLSSVPCALSTDTQQQNYGESDLSSHIHSNRVDVKQKYRTTGNHVWVQQACLLQSRRSRGHTKLAAGSMEVGISSQFQFDVRLISVGI